MRDWTGIPYWEVTKDRLVKNQGDIDYFLRDLSAGMSRIQKGYVPDGSGDTIINKVISDLYFYLPGRRGGQLGYFDTDSGGSGTLSSTRHGTKGKIYLGSNKTSMFDEFHDRLGVNSEPAGNLHVQGKLGGGDDTQTLTPITDIDEGGWGSAPADSHSLATQTNDGDTTYVQSTDGPGAGDAGIGVEVAITPPAATTNTSGWSLHIVGRKTAAADHIGIDVSLGSKTGWSGGSFTGGDNWFFDEDNYFGTNAGTQAFTTSHVDYEIPLTATQAQQILNVDTDGGAYITVELTTRINFGDTGTAGCFINVTQIYISAPAPSVPRATALFENRASQSEPLIMAIDDGGMGDTTDRLMNLTYDGSLQLGNTTDTPEARLIDMLVSDSRDGSNNIIHIETALGAKLFQVTGVGMLQVGNNNTANQNTTKLNLLGPSNQAVDYMQVVDGVVKRWSIDQDGVMKIGSSTAVEELGMIMPTGGASYDITWPASQGAANSLLENDGSGNLAWTTTPTIGVGVTLTIEDEDLTIVDDGDNTKAFQFEASSITSGQTREYTMPDADGVMTLEHIALAYAVAL